LLAHQPPSDQLRQPFLLDTLLHKLPVPLSGLPCPISKLFQDIMGIPPPVLKTLSITERLWGVNG